MTDTTQIPPADAKADDKSADPTFWQRLDTRTVIVLWMMLSMFVIIVLCWWKPPSADNQLLNTLLGMYGSTGFVTAVGWWMGSSKGSEDKSAAINKQMTGTGS